MDGQNDKLQKLEEAMKAFSVFGQWQVGANRPQNVVTGPNGQRIVEPLPSGVPHIWPWKDLYPFLASSREALTDSFTARRSLILTNPGLGRGTTQTILAGIQSIGPGEIAWAHRHTVTALRFCIEGNKDVFTVVGGDALIMEPYDLILTPGQCWHDHHNESNQPAAWLDVLDVPLLLALNQNFYEELGPATQEQNDSQAPSSPHLRPAWKTTNTSSAGAYRYPWAETRAQLDAMADGDTSPHDGVALEYTNAQGGPTLKTLSCWVQLLPPGFKGKPHRHSSSAVYFVISGEGRTVLDEQNMAWEKHDNFVIPNWTWHAHENNSKTEPAILFSVNDTPLLQAFDFYREEPKNTLARNMRS
jgi:1-hydroxy-2-naphthoate dioxygenase